jgi:hypothetical protein
MSEPAGRVIGTLSVVRGCGCSQTVERFDRDRFLEQRLAKLRKTRCPACAAKFAESQRQAAAVVPKRGEALAALPAGTVMTLSKVSDTVWSGTLLVDGETLELTGDTAGGVTVALAQRWVMARRASR